MKDETHAKAISIKKEISELEEHKTNVLKHLTNGYLSTYPTQKLNSDNFTIEVSGSNYGNGSYALKSRFMLIDKVKAMEMYLDSVDKHIGKLNDEFNAL